MVEEFLKKTVIFSIFWFVFLFFFKLPTYGQLYNENCLLKTFNNNNNLYFLPESTICAISDKAGQIPKNFGFPKVLILEKKNEDSPHLFVNNIEFENLKIEPLLKKYYRCENGNWIEEEITDTDLYCQMNEDFWDSCFSGACTPGGGSDSIQVRQAEINKVQAEKIDLVPSEDTNYINFIVTKTLSATPTPPPSLPSSLPEGAIRCYSFYGNESILDDNSENISVSQDNFENPSESLRTIFGKEDDEKWGCIKKDFILGDVEFCMSDFVDEIQEQISGLIDSIKDLRDSLMDEQLDPCPSGYKKIAIDENCFCTPLKNSEKIEEICNKIVNQSEKDSCKNCLESTGYWSAVGCVNFSSLESLFAENIFGPLIGLAGVIALFCIIYAAFQIQSSQGSPEKIKNAQQLLTSCIMGLIMIIFSVFILRLIGVDILKIPGFS